MTTFKVMTFNIRGSLFEMDGDNIWENRADLNLATIKKYDPDIIGFQEFQSGNHKFYDEHLTGYAYELGLKTIDKGAFYHQTPIFWKPNRFELVDTDSFFLSETPSEWSLSWDSSLVRGAMWVILRDKDTGIEFMHMNTHLDHIGEEARVEGSKLIVQKIEACADGRPLIVTADFNSRAWAIPEDQIPSELIEHLKEHPPSPAGTVHSVYTEAGFRDSYLESGNEEDADTNTFHGFKGHEFAKLGYRIDWVLIRDGSSHKIMASQCEIIRDEVPPIYPSDHYPVMATLDLM